MILSKEAFTERVPRVSECSLFHRLRSEDFINLDIDKVKRYLIDMWDTSNPVVNILWNEDVYRVTVPNLVDAVLVDVIRTYMNDKADKHEKTESIRRLSTMFSGQSINQYTGLSYDEKKNISLFNRYFKEFVDDIIALTNSKKNCNLYDSIFYNYYRLMRIVSNHFKKKELARIYSELTSQNTSNKRSYTRRSKTGIFSSENYYY